MAAGFYKFQALLYKGYLFRKRHFITTLFEFIFPVLIACIPVIILSQIDIPEQFYGRKTAWVNSTVHHSFNPLKGKTDIKEGNVLFAFAPANDNTFLLMEKSVQLWKSHHNLKSVNVSLKDGDELENYCLIKQRDNDSLIIIGTIFNNVPSNGKKLPSNLDYTIRYSNPYQSGFATNLKYRFSKAYNVYSSSTFFLSWQAAVEKIFIQEKMAENNKSLDYELWMQELPYPSHKEVARGFNMAELVPALISYGLIIFIGNCMQRVIEEKSSGCKELLKMMGMTDLIYWCSTFINYFIVAIVIFLSITIAYKSPLQNSAILLENSDFFLLFFLFLLYASSFILFSLAMSTFFNKALFGIIVFIIAYNVSFSFISSFIFIPSMLEVTYYPLSRLAKFCICLLPSGSILTLTEMILVFESSGEGIQWSNLSSFDAIPDFNLAWVIFAITFSCFLYVIIIWYVDAVWPWQYGVPKPFYFPFTKSYWTGFQEKKINEILLDSNDEPKNSEFFEDDPSGISPGVIINNLSKVFRNGLNKKVAVNNLSLNIYTGQITALLGHNGAGKTTAINILTGLISPSNGTASINGFDIFSQTIQARKSLGVCPQQNILYDSLTVEEHLKMYATLKGVTWDHLNQETLEIVKVLDLVAKKNVLSKNLSGGMKRKLCLGIAIIGGSKVLFLDEPTSGLDVEARRNVWNALLDLRHNRTIVLTTHYMEEADILGDRIAIMTDGEIQCCGSPLFLKKKFGTGYHLHLVKKENFDVTAVKNLVARIVPSALLEIDNEGDVTFNLMTNNQSNFGTMFEEIEQNKDSLGINSCGVTVTTMDDVFLNIATLRKVTTTDQKYQIEDADETEIKDLYIESNEFGKTHKFEYQFYGLFMKRLHCAKRHWNILLVQLILPFVILSFCLYNISFLSYHSSASESALKLDALEIYGGTDGFYQSYGNTSSNSMTIEIQKVLQENGVNIIATNNPIEFVLSYSKNSLADYYKRLMVSGTTETSNGTLNLTAWFNGFAYHAEPISLLLMDTAILRSVTKSGYITLINHPLPHVDTFYYEDIYYTRERIFANMYVTLALTFLSASFVLVPIHERTSKAKLLQMMTGISPATYWLPMFLWDFIINTIVSILLILPFAIFGHYAFFSSHSEAIGTALIIMFLFGWASIPFAYLFSLIIRKPNNGFSIVNFINIIIGAAICSIFTTVLRYLSVKEHTAVKVFVWLLKFFPIYSLSSGFSNLFAIAYSNAYCDSLSPRDLKYNCMKEQLSSPILKCCKDICGNNCLVEVNPLTMEEDACGRDILFLYLDGILYFCILLFLESPFSKSLSWCICRRIWSLRKIIDNHNIDRKIIEDSDVLQEEERIKNNLEQVCHNDALVIHNLVKTFKNVKAIDHLTFGIHEKECFGLLGVNGAGKTTTFRILTGDCVPTKGNAYINNYSVTTNLKKFQSYIGYCPQFDALIDRLSAREMITLFARLRGLNGPNMTRYVNALIRMTDLTQYADKPSMVYSGGNKRKLSIALALIGAPPLVLLDEPTAGVDPVSRRKIWKILSLARIYSGAAVILTTHSMEESEALCSRLAIMVNGRLRCLGSIQHLKSKFGQGYTLIIKVKKGEQSLFDSVNGIKTHIDSNLPGANLKDEHQTTLQYHVVHPSVTLSHLFKFMDDMKREYYLEDYVISDTSLEQIFLTFAKSQRVNVNAL